MGGSYLSEWYGKSRDGSPYNPGKRMIQWLARLVPRRFRSDIPIVPVVRISGVIGGARL
jgi:hypothetical protein